MVLDHHVCGGRVPADPGSQLSTEQERWVKDGELGEALTALCLITFNLTKLGGKILPLIGKNVRTREGMFSDIITALRSQENTGSDSLWIRVKNIFVEG